MRPARARSGGVQRMFRRSGRRFADKNMRKSKKSRACSDSEGTEHALAPLDHPLAREPQRELGAHSADLLGDHLRQGRPPVRQAGDAGREGGPVDAEEAREVVDLDAQRGVEQVGGQQPVGRRAAVEQEAVVLEPAIDRHALAPRSRYSRRSSAGRWRSERSSATGADASTLTMSASRGSHVRSPRNLRMSGLTFTSSSNTKPHGAPLAMIARQATLWPSQQPISYGPIASGKSAYARSAS